MPKRSYRFCDEEETAVTSIPIVLSSMGGGDSPIINPFAGMPTDNHIYLYDDIETDTILSLNKNIKELNTSLKKEFSKYSDHIDYRSIPIYIHINSYGGDLFAGLAAVDAILSSECPIYTVVEGASASAATFLSVVGKKRFVTKHSFMLIHQLSSGMWGKFEELKDEMENNEMFMGVIKNLYKEYTKLTDEQIEVILKKDLWFDANKAVEYGLADEVI